MLGAVLEAMQNERTEGTVRLLCEFRSYDGA